MNIEPLGHRVLVKEHKKGEIRQGEIILPGGEDLTEYEVLKVGPGMWSSNGVLMPPQVEVGDIVLLEVRALEKNQSVRIGAERVWLIEAPMMVAKVKETVQ